MNIVRALCDFGYWIGDNLKNVTFSATVCCVVAAFPILAFVSVYQKEAARAEQTIDRRCVVRLPDIAAFMRQDGTRGGPSASAMPRKVMWFPCVDVHGWQDT